MPDREQRTAHAVRGTGNLQTSKLSVSLFISSRSLSRTSLGGTTNGRMERGLVRGGHPEKEKTTKISDTRSMMPALRSRSGDVEWEEKPERLSSKTGQREEMGITACTCVTCTDHESDVGCRFVLAPFWTSALLEHLQMATAGVASVASALPAPTQVPPSPARLPALTLEVMPIRRTFDERVRAGLHLPLLVALPVGSTSLNRNPV